METAQQLPINWQSFLKDEIDQMYYKSILSKVDIAYDTNVCYPSKNQIFNAFKATSHEDIKVVIIGQDPYHGAGEANGLAFSVNEGIKIPPSLRNIFKEINVEFEHVFTPTSGNLNRWAAQGVLLLNASLTVQKDSANSHKNIGWQQFTDAVIKNISDKKSAIVFMLWGNFAHQKSKIIDAEKHCILTSGHPSPMSANQGKWFGNNHFKMANHYLRTHNKNEIDW